MKLNYKIKFLLMEQDKTFIRISRSHIEHEIRKYNPMAVYYHLPEIIEIIEGNHILSNELMGELSDDDIESLYINLKLGFLIHQFGKSKVEYLLNDFIESK